MSFKRTKVVMLPTEKSSDIILRTRDNVIHQRKYYGTAWEDMGDVYQHLYFLSDDEIKEGDWVLLANNSIVKAVVGKYQLDTIIGFNTGIGNVVKRFSKSDRKIIATTDKSLVVSKDTGIVGIEYNLPQPSEGFIQKFVDAYNIGKPIREVYVEYEEYFEYDITNKKESLKVNSKDNTITIKKAKDSWNRDEVATLILQSNLDSHVAKEGEFDIMHWIAENLV